MLLIFYFIRDFFGFVFEILSSVVGWFVSIISLIGSCIGFLGSLFVALPTLFKVSLIGLVAVSVIYKVLGREGQD